MSRSFKKYVYYLSPIADQPIKYMKRAAARKVRKYECFEDVSNGSWYRKTFDSDKINGWVSWRIWFDNKTIIERNFELYCALKRK